MCLLEDQTWPAAMSKIEIEEDDHQESHAGQVIGSNYDLTSQILVCLPPKSICNLKLTSKQWFSISSDPIFIRNHTIRHPRALSGLFLDYITRPQASSHEYIAAEPSNEAYGRPMPFVKAQNCLGVKILQSCNGLLLCLSFNLEYYVCNPTTLQRKQVPLPKGVRPGGEFGLNLAFNPKISPHYKVVCVRKVFGLQSRYQLDVYSSETGQWKTVGEPFIEPDVLYFKHGVFCKGAIHWLKTTSACLYFDVDLESLKSTPESPPGKQCPLYTHEYFGQSNDRLYYVVKTHLPNFTLLQMREDYSGWFVKQVVNLDILANQFPIMARNFDRTQRFLPHYECNVLCITGSEGGLDEDDNVELVLSMPGKIVRFNPRTDASREVADLVLRPHNASVWYRDFLVHEYFETLCPV